MKNSAILIIVLVAGVIAPLDAQGQNYVVTLAEAQAVALEKAFAMQYAALDRSKAERDVKGVLASGLPQVNLIADYSQYIDIPTQVAAGDVFGFPEYLTSFLGGVSQATGVSLNQHLLIRTPSRNFNLVRPIRLMWGYKQVNWCSAVRILWDCVLLSFTWMCRIGPRKGQPMRF